MNHSFLLFPVVATVLLSACSTYNEAAVCSSSEAVHALRADSDYTIISDEGVAVDKEGFTTLILPRPALFENHEIPSATPCTATIATEGSVATFHQHVQEVLGEVGIMAVRAFRDNDEETGLVADFVDQLESTSEAHPHKRLTLSFNIDYAVDATTGAFVSFASIHNGLHQSSVAEAYYNALRSLQQDVSE